ncbi:MAG: hypothetical protein QM820_62695 [Minicystis sp.]
MRPSAFALFAFTFVTFALAGCKSSVVPACREICNCSPCTTSDLDACVDKAQKAQESAYAQQCTEVFDTFVDCFETHVTCSQGTAVLGEGCSRAERNLATCADAGSPFATVCDEAAAKVLECLPKTMPGTQPACTGATACQSRCIVQASCEVISGMQFDQTFNDCINQCSGIPTPSPGGPE